MGLPEHLQRQLHEELSAIVGPLEWPGPYDPKTQSGEDVIRVCVSALAAYRVREEILQEAHEKELGEARDLASAEVDEQMRAEIDRLTAELELAQRLKDACIDSLTVERELEQQLRYAHSEMTQRLKDTRIEMAQAFRNLRQLALLDTNT